VSALRLLLVDDEPAIRLFLAAFLNGEPDMTVVGEADDGPEAVRAARTLQPDLILCDVQMPLLSGVDALPMFFEAAPNTQVVFYSAKPIDERAFALGALDWIDKAIPVAELPERLRQAMLRSPQAQC
jgi:DNA-binding NarL/FixJ family response regulator